MKFLTGVLKVVELVKPDFWQLFNKGMLINVKNIRNVHQVVTHTSASGAGIIRFLEIELSRFIQ